MVIKQNVAAEEFNRLANSYQCEVDGLAYLAEGEPNEDLRNNMLESKRIAESCLENLLRWASTSEYDVDIEKHTIDKVKIRMTDSELYYAGVYSHSTSFLKDAGYTKDYAEQVLDDYIEWRKKRDEKKRNIVDQWEKYSETHAKPVKKAFAEEIGEEYYFVIETIRESQK